MSTRATYRIKSEKTGGPHTIYFYIHYDGYPKGGAAYFKECLSNEKAMQRGGIQKAFASLEYSEFTHDHEAHWDTEYRYNIFENEKGVISVNVQKMFYLDSNGQMSLKEWKTIFNDSMEKFIEQHAEKQT